MRGLSQRRAPLLAKEGIVIGVVIVAVIVVAAFTVGYLIGWTRGAKGYVKIPTPGKP